MGRQRYVQFKDSETLTHSSCCSGLAIKYRITRNLLNRHDNQKTRMPTSVGQDKDDKSPEEPPASPQRLSESALAGDDDAYDAHLKTAWPESTSEPGEEPKSKVQRPYDGRDQVEPRVDLDTGPPERVQIEVDPGNSRDSRSAAETSTNTTQRHDPEDFRESWKNVQNAMNQCAPDLHHLRHNEEPMYLRREDFKLPANLCKYTSDLVSTAKGAAPDPQPNDSDTVEGLKRLALAQRTLIEHISKPLEMLRFYIDAWHLRAADDEKRPGADVGLDPTVPTPQQAEMEAFLDLTRQHNKLNEEYAQLCVQARRQRPEPTSSKTRPSWDWPQAKRVCPACREKFDIQAKEKEEGEGKVCVNASDEEDLSIASSPMLSVPSSRNGKPDAVGGAVTEYMAGLEEWADEAATFSEEQARLLQQPLYISPTDSPRNSVAQLQEGRGILEPTPLYPLAPSPPRASNAYMRRRRTDAEGESQSHYAPDDTSSVASFLDSYGLHQEDSPQSRREQYWEDCLRQECKKKEYWRGMYDELAERHENAARSNEKWAKLYNCLARRWENLTEMHEETTTRFEREMHIHNTVMEVYVTNAVEVDWTRSSSQSRSNDRRSMSPPLSPRGTPSPMTVPTSLDSTEASQWASIEPRACGTASQRAQGTAGVEKGPVATARLRKKPRNELFRAEAAVARERRSAPGVAQALSFSDFVENQCRSWVDICDFLWSFILPVRQPAILVSSAGGSSSPIQDSRQMGRNAEMSFIPWSAVFNVLTHIILLFGIQTWIACAKERNTWLHANNIKPTTLLSLYARGERSFWPGLHGGLLTGAEVSMLAKWILLNSRRVLELLARVVQGLDLANQESMRVLVLGAMVLMFARIG